MVGGSKLDQSNGSVAERGAARLLGGRAEPVRTGEWMLKSASTDRDGADLVVAERVELDMGMGSRVEGFRICGHR